MNNKDASASGTVKEAAVVTAAAAAANLALKTWADTLVGESSENLLAGLDRVMDGLQQFRNALWANLPPQNGGLGGYPVQHWMKLLDGINVDVYETEKRDCFYGYTGDADNYATLTDALVAAIMANKDALGLELPDDATSAPKF